MSITETRLKISRPVKYIFLLVCFFAYFSACTESKNEERRWKKSRQVATEEGFQEEAGDSATAYRIYNSPEKRVPGLTEDDPIIDADYSFEEAIAGTTAPQRIIDSLALFDVCYLSVDGKIHRGQILSNKKIEAEIRSLFRSMLEKGFVIGKAIPIVRYGWNDSLSMADNNSYSFCYRNVSYSKHATGMAIDINPQFNPIRWKSEARPNQPEGAVSDTTVNGTFYPGHPVVKEFAKLGFRWGHTFTKFHDDHHFEKK